MSLWVSDSLVSGGKELLFMGSCENPKGRLGVLTVGRRAVFLEGLAVCRPGRVCSTSRLTLSAQTALLMSQTCKALDIQDETSVDACTMG